MNRSDEFQEREASKFLSSLIKGGFVDTTLSPFDERASRHKYFEWFSKISTHKRDRGQQETFELWPAPQSQRWQENHLEAALLIPSTDYWAVEVARFCVPDGQIGFVKRIEQVITDVTYSYYPTSNVYWGSPNPPLNDVANLRWYLTLSFFDGLLPPRFVANNTAPIPVHYLPGQPYTDLPEIDALWYPAHNNKPMKLIVPGGRLLRFYVMSPPTTVYQWIVEGKLSGYTQSTYQLAALRNAREFD